MPSRLSFHVRAGTRRAQTLSWLMNEMVQEPEDDPPGAEVASTQLAHLMFIQILRAHFDSSDSLATGWLRATNCCVSSADARRAWPNLAS
jgi:hypothetical protein